MKFNFKELDVVYLKQDIPSEKLPAGAIGTVVLIHTNPHEAYEVEFCNSAGRSKLASGTVTLYPGQIEKYELDINSEELRILASALNEILNGPEAIEDCEFSMRIGSDRLTASELLNKISKHIRFSENQS